MVLKNAIKFELIFNDMKVDANFKPSEKKNGQQVLGDNRWQDTVTRTSINWCNGLFIRSFDHLAKWSIWNVIGPFVEGLAGGRQERAEGPWEEQTVSGTKQASRRPRHKNRPLTAAALPLLFSTRLFGPVSAN